VERIGYEQERIDGKYVDGKYIRDLLSVSRTKAYEIMIEIEKGSRERGEVIRFGRSKRVRMDALERWVLEHCVGGTATA
jgi:hypothetical protein